MRLFGNIYGGEVALGVITGLTIAIVPVFMVGLEFLLNFMQALIFSVLTLMFTIIAIERPTTSTMRRTTTFRRGTSGRPSQQVMQQAPIEPPGQRCP